MAVEISQNFPPAQTFPDLGTLVTVIARNIVVLASILLFVLLIFGGVKFIVSAGGGDEQGVGKGKNAITAALVGFLLIFTAYWLVQIIERLTGFSIFAPGV
jgi:hypothetical protein